MDIVLNCSSYWISSPESLALPIVILPLHYIHLSWHSRHPNDPISLSLYSNTKTRSRVLAWTVLSPILNSICTSVLLWARISRAIRIQYYFIQLYATFSFVLLSLLYVRMLFSSFPLFFFHTRWFDPVLSELEIVYSSRLHFSIFKLLSGNGISFCIRD